MNKLQRYLIVSRDGKRVIGTPSGQAFMEDSAHRHMEQLAEVRNRKKDFQVVEITGFLDALTQEVEAR